jgi:hypothetical protein
VEHPRSQGTPISPVLQRPGKLLLTVTGSAARVKVKGAGERVESGPEVQGQLLMAEAAITAAELPQIQAAEPILGVHLRCVVHVCVCRIRALQSAPLRVDHLTCGVLASARNQASVCGTQLQCMLVHGAGGIYCPLRYTYKHLLTLMPK